MTQSREKNRRSRKIVVKSAPIKKSIFEKWKDSNILVGLATYARRFSKNHAILFSLFGTFVLTFPPYFLQQYYQIDRFALKIKEYLPDAGEFLDRYMVIGVFASCVWAFFIIAFYKFLKSIYQENPNGWTEMPTLLLRSIDNIVGTKEQRFSRFLIDLQNSDSPINIGQTFNSITQPASQLNELVQGLHSSMLALLQLENPGEKFTLKVNFAQMQDGYINDIPFHYPNNHSVKTPIHILNKPNSSIRHAANTKSILIIESIKRELDKDSPRFSPNPTRKDEDGSLICYPIFYEKFNSVIFVISIYSDQHHYFKTRFKASYIELLRSFELRMKLEFSLLGIRELSNEQAIQSSVD